MPSYYIEEKGPIGLALGKFTDNFRLFTRRNSTCSTGNVQGHSSMLGLAHKNNISRMTSGESISLITKAKCRVSK